MNLMILDGNSIANRAFYGIKSLNAPDGTPTNAVYGFIVILQRLLSEIEPDAVCVCFDLKSPTFSQKAYSFYKANRHPMPDELAVQMPIIKETLSAMGINCYEAEGYEADDILGTASSVCGANGWNCTVVTGDRDSLQLIGDSTKVCMIKTAAGKSDLVLYDEELFKSEYGFEPIKLIDLKSLMGDSSDNIPGVKGVGSKTASDLIIRFGSLEGIYNALEAGDPDIKGAVKTKLEAGKEDAQASYWLATIKRDIPLEFIPENNLWSRSYRPELYDVFKRLGFVKFINEFGLSKQASPIAEKKTEIIKHTVDADNLAAALAAIASAEVISFFPDTELESFQVCTGDEIWAFDRLSAGFEYENCVAEILSSHKTIVSINVKEIYNRAKALGLYDVDINFDAGVAAYLVDSTYGKYELGDISSLYLDSSSGDSKDLFDLYFLLDSKMKELEMSDLFYNIEMPLCRVLSDMEEMGFPVDRNALYEFGESLNGIIDGLKADIYKEVGHEFNINSPKQLGEVLFEELCLPMGKKTKSGWSTNADILEKLRFTYPVVQNVLDYRMYTKLKSTYADGLLKVIASDGRIHSSFQNTVTATGRLSSTEPNLQNIPIRKEIGAKIREMFIAGNGNVLVDADYSQIELRILAHMSHDKVMQDAFLSGEDFHRVTASHIYNVPIESVTSRMRSSAKAVNFGIVYGISAFSLADDIGVKPAEARQFIEAYLNKYSGLNKYLTDIVKQAKADTYVSTLYGRRRKIPELASSNFNVRSFGERVALNMPVQGTAADIIKIAMINVYNRLKSENMKSRIILQVHDELILECPADEAEKAAKIIKYEMENAAALEIPLTVEVKTGHTWAEAH